MQTLRINALAFCLVLLAAATAARGQCFETSTLAPADSQNGDRIGATVAASGAIAMVGAPDAEGVVPGSGAVYQYDIETGELVRAYTTNDPLARGFGRSIALHDGLALVGAANGFGCGPVSIFDTETGALISRFHSSLGTYEGGFGSAVAVSGSIAVIGAAWEDVCFVFDISNPASPVELASFRPAQWANGFGASLAVAGDTVVVGIGDVWDTRAFLFDISDPQHPVERATLHLTNDRPSGWRHRYGTPVGIEGNLAIVGTYNDDYGDTLGSTVSIFDTTTGKQIGTLRPPKAFEYDLFGVSVSIAGTTVAVGTPDWSGYVGPRVFLYDVSNPANPWLLGQLALNDPGWGFLGWSIALADSKAVSGAPWDPGNEPEAGAAYLFDLTRCDFCPADFNDDGGVDPRDVLDFLSAWTTGGAEADFNFDRELDTRDVLAFLNAWAAGC